MRMMKWSTLFAIALGIAIVPEALPWPGDEKQDEAEQDEAKQDEARLAELTNRLAALLQEKNFAEAAAVFRDKLELERRLLGNEHPAVLETLKHMAMVLFWGAHREDEALEVQGEAARAAAAAFGKEDWRARDAERILARFRRIRGLNAEKRGRIEESRRLGAEYDAAWGERRLGDAVPLAEKAIAAAEDALGEADEEALQHRLQLGFLLRITGDLAGAEKMFRRALETADDALVKGHPEKASALEGLADVASSRGKYAAARGFLTEAIDLLRKAPGGPHLEYPACLRKLGSSHRHEGNLAEAEPILLEAIEASRSVYGPVHARYGNALHDHAGLLYMLGKYDEAAAGYEQALEIMGRSLGKESQHYAVVLDALARVHTTTGAYAKAEPLLLEAIEVIGKILGKEHGTYASMLHSLALLCYYRGDLARAESLYRTALDITRRTLGTEHPDYASTLHTLAMVYVEMGDAASAEPLYEESIAIRKKVHGEKSREHAMTLQNLAHLYLGLGENDRAVPLFEKAVAAARASLGPDHPDVATLLFNLAQAHLGKGDMERARSLYEEAFDKTKAALKDSPSLANRIQGLAHLHLQTGDLARAEELCREAIDMRDKILGPDHPESADGQKLLAQVLLLAGRDAEARKTLENVIASMNRHVDLCAVAQSERQQLLMASKLRSALHLYLSLSADTSDPAQSFGHVLAWKGGVAVRQRALRAARRDTAAAPRVEELGRVSRRLAQAVFTGPGKAGTDVWRREVDALAREKEDVEKELAAKAPLGEITSAAGQKAAEALRSSLPEGTALVDFFEYSQLQPVEPQRGKTSPVEAVEGKRGPRGGERRLVAHVLRADQPIARLDLGPLAPVEERVKAFRRALDPEAGEGVQEGDAGSAGAELRRLLWTPLEKTLRGAGHVLISPSAALASIPFGALPGEKPGSYLVEEVALALVPVPRLLTDLLRESAGERGQAAAPDLLAVGGVDYGAPAGSLPGTPGEAPDVLTVAAAGFRSAPRGKTDRAWPPLDYTSEEIAAVARLFRAAREGGKVTELTADAATEEAFRRLAPRHAYLHVASHGFFAPAELRSALEEVLPDKFSGAAPARFPRGWQPGLLSGLVLAGANTDPNPLRDDGILTADELQQLDLEGVDLLVLSACETGLGAAAGGEGVLGLVRAAQIAGARSMVTSLWKVGDLETRAFMVRFYTNHFERRMSRLDALRDAQLAALRGELAQGAGNAKRGPGAVRKLSKDAARRGAARTWAAWVLSGDWR
ncbi:MAG TPA: tetratricopeptide repeat protein [Planctomycetota bacterium]|nr:tetratricopeptide repeat protein [Planctomycetota bacterium]